MRYFIIACLTVLTLAACRPETYVPRPRGYFKIDLPAHKYQYFEGKGFPYSFEFPAYGNIVRDTTPLGLKNPYWINIDFPSLGGRLYLTYKQIEGEGSFARLLEDAHQLTVTAHSKRADYIDNPPFDNGHNVMGRFYTVGGNQAATRYQFFATDSAKHFIHAALYFDAYANADSLQPVADFLKKDMEHMIETMRWNN